MDVQRVEPKGVQWAVSRAVLMAVQCVEPRGCQWAVLMAVP